MFEINLGIEVTNFAAVIFHPDDNFSKRQVNAIIKHANWQTADFWFRNFLPNHFNAKQAQYVTIKDRKPPYKDIKQKLARGMAIKGIGKERVQRGGSIHNVRSGLTERQAKSSGIVEATAVRAKVTMTVPRYSTIRRKDPSMPFTPTEVTAVSQSEYRMLAMRWQAEFVNTVRNVRAGFRIK